MQWQNEFTIAHSSKFTTVTGKFYHAEGWAESTVPAFLPTFFTDYKRDCKRVSSLKTQHFSILKGMSATQSLPIPLAGRRATVTPVGIGSRGQVRIPALLSHHNANEVMPTSKPWKALLLSSLGKQTYWLTHVFADKWTFPYWCWGTLIHLQHVVLWEVASNCNDQNYGA